LRIVKAVGCATLAVLLCVVGYKGIAASKRFEFVVLSSFPFVAAVYASLLACICFLGPGKAQPVTPVPDDGGQLSNRLRAWITANRGGRFGGASRLVVRGFGKVMVGVGTLLCCTAGATMFTSSQPRQVDFGPSFLFLLFVLGVPGVFLYLIGRGLSARRAVDVLNPEGPRPILLLRSFCDDGATLPTGSSTVENNINPLKSLNSFEETLTATFERVGPVVAVGRPGELLPPSGAARAYLSNEQWQAWVADLLAWSQQVVMLLGSPKLGETEDGLTWEILHVYDTVAPQKIILLIPPHLSEDEVRKRWTSYAELLGRRFPPYRPDALLIRYDCDWTASIVSTWGLRGVGPRSNFESVKTAVAWARDWSNPALGFEITKVECS
jgi:hypothetical protein